MSPHMRDAIISVEERDFYNHGAVSAIGIGRAFANNFLNPKKRQGASTLTQQYVNNLIVDSDAARRRPHNPGGNKGYLDKIKEMKLAISMGRTSLKTRFLRAT